MVGIALWQWLQAFVLVLAVVLSGSAVVRDAGLRVAAAAEMHSVVRTFARTQALAAVRGEPVLHTAHFEIYYPRGDHADARIIATEAERAYPFVFGHLGGAPAGPIAIRVETRASLARLLHGNPAADPLGVYWKGIVWFLTPSAYLSGDPAERAATFARVGPVAHELTHLADDRLTGGRMPAWLDEGVAQYIEWKYNGYLWLQPGNTFCQPLYSWKQLASSFDALSNVALAYHESFAIIDAVAHRPGGIAKLLRSLGAGQPTDAALARAIGATHLNALMRGSAWKCATTTTARSSPPAPNPHSGPAS